MKQIRQAGPADASSLAALALEVWIGTYLRAGINGFFADFALSAFTPETCGAWIADPADRVLVSQNDVGIDGFVRLKTGAPDPVGAAAETEIATLYVQPRHQGQGIGAALLQVALADCVQRDIAAVWLAVNSENTGALRFYAREGFDRAGQTHFEIGDQRYLNEVLIKQLPAAPGAGGGM